MVERQPVTCVQPDGVWRRLRDGWYGVAGRFGAIQTLVLLGFFYALLIGPASLAARLAGRDLLERGPLSPGESGWRDADSAPPDLERARLTS